MAGSSFAGVSTTSNSKDPNLVGAIQRGLVGDLSEQQKKNKDLAEEAWHNSLRESLASVDWVVIGSDADPHHHLEAA